MNPLPSWVNVNNQTANLPPDDYDVLGSITVAANYTLNLSANTSILMASGTRLSINGAAANFNGVEPGDNQHTQRIHFARLDPNSAWDKIWVNAPFANCTFDGCIVDGADWPLYLSASTVANPVRVIHVLNSYLKNAGWQGLYLNGQLQGVFESDSIAYADRDGISINYNQLVAPNLTKLQGITIHDCNPNANHAEGALNVYRSNPTVDGCEFKHNRDNGMYITSTSNVDIGSRFGQVGANNLFNNGVSGSQTNTYGAEIRVADANSMNGAEILRCNIYDLRDPNQVWARQGKIVAKSTGAAFTLNLCYYADGRHNVANAAAGDFYSSGGGAISWNNNVQANPNAPDTWDENGDGEGCPTNSFEAGLIALQGLEYRQAIEDFESWIAENPAALESPSAVAHILFAQRSLGSDLSGVRNDFLQMAEVYSGYEALAWMAKECAVECLEYSGEYSNALDERQQLRDVTPTFADSVFNEIDIIDCQRTLSGDHTDAMTSSESKIRELLNLTELANNPEVPEPGLNILPTEFSLEAVYPNPFNESVRIGYGLPEATDVKLAVYDLSGRLVSHLAADWQPAGRYEQVWHAAGIPAGMYLLRFEAAGHLQTRKLIMVK